MPIPVPSISCCVLNHHNLFYQIKNAPPFNRDTCCHLALCLWLLPFHYPFILTKIFHENSASCGRKPIGRKTFDRHTEKELVDQSKELLNLLMLIGPPDEGLTSHEAGLLNKSSCLAPALGATMFVDVRDMILATLCCAT